MIGDLRRLEALRLAYGAEAAARKATLLGKLTGRHCASAASLVRYHEILCWMAAYPDDRRLLDRVMGELRRFALRADLARFRDALGDSGIAGTTTRYPFFWMMARWLAVRHPRRLRLDWDRAEFDARLRAALPLLLPGLVAEAVKRSPRQGQALIDRLRGPDSDAVFIARSIERLPGDTFTREHLHDSIDAAYVLAPGMAGPSRTLAWHGAAPLVFRATRPPAGRPDLIDELRRAPRRVRQVRGAEAVALVGLAREAMLTRARDLAAFSWGDERDVCLVDDGDGLAFALIGSVPERRLPLPAVHGWLMLRNRVPVGYVQTDCLLAGAEVSFNVFPTFRGAEAATLFGRVLAVARHVLGARAFSIEPYQLGEGNEEGIESGAWWFYYKLGFRPIAAGPRQLLARELQRSGRQPSHRSSEATLRGLARGHMVFEPERGQRAWLPQVPGLGLALHRGVADVPAEAALRRFGVRDFARWTGDEQFAWRRLAPVLLSLGGVEAWSRSARAQAVAVARAKGGVHEIGFLRALDAHVGLAASLQVLLGSPARA